MKIVMATVIGIIIGILLAVVLFYDGFNVFPLLEWESSLRDSSKNCLMLRTEALANSASYRELICQESKLED